MTHARNEEAARAGVVGDAFRQQVLFRKNEGDGARAHGPAQLLEAPSDAGEGLRVAHRREVLVVLRAEIELAVEEALDQSGRLRGVSDSRLGAREVVDQPGDPRPDRLRLAGVVQERRPVLALVGLQCPALELQALLPGVLPVGREDPGQEETQNHPGEPSAHEHPTSRPQL